MSSGPWREEAMPWNVQRGLEIAAEAQALYADSLDQTLTAESADTRARAALQLAVSALNWLEGTEREQDAHQVLHDMGRQLRVRFPETCLVTWNGTEYAHTCPARLSHKRFGFSPGLIVGRRTCILCGQDSSECEHLPGREYLVRGGMGPAHCCRVCARSECSEHTPEKEYWVRPTWRIEEIIEMTELSIVNRPRQPDARIVSIPLNNGELRQQFGSSFNVGDPLYCHYCLEPCEGFQYWRPSREALDTEVDKGQGDAR